MIQVERGHRHRASREGDAPSTMSVRMRRGRQRRRDERRRGGHGEICVCAGEWMMVGDPPSQLRRAVRPGPGRHVVLLPRARPSQRPSLSPTEHIISSSLLSAFKSINLPRVTSPECRRLFPVRCVRARASLIPPRLAPRRATTITAVTAVSVPTTHRPQMWICVNVIVQVTIEAVVSSGGLGRWCGDDGRAARAHPRLARLPDSVIPQSHPSYST